MKINKVENLGEIFQSTESFKKIIIANHVKILVSCSQSKISNYCIP